MKCLGISSAISTISASVVTDGAVISEFSIAGENAKSERLIPIIDSVLKSAYLKITKVDLIAVTKGPGSYSGLRGGLAVAKSFASTLNVPVEGVSTMEAIAYNFINSIGTVAVVLHACQDEYNIALFSSNGSSQKRLTDDLVLKYDRIIEIISKINGRLTLSSEKKIYDGVMKNNINSEVDIADTKNAIPWACNVAKIGLRKFMAGEKQDHLSMVPEYSHRPNIREYKA